MPASEWLIMAAFTVLAHAPEPSDRMHWDSIFEDRQAAEDRAVELMGKNPCWRFEVVNDRGSIVWSPEWVAGEPKDPPANQS